MSGLLILSQIVAAGVTFTCTPVPPPSIDRSVRAIVSELVGSTRRPQRELLARTGLSKDQLILSGNSGCATIGD
jgi:hypothetical protein